MKRKKNDARLNLLEFSGKAELQQGRLFVSVHQNISAKVLEV